MIHLPPKLAITSLNTTATDDFMSTVENVEDLAIFDEDTISARAQKFSIPESEEEDIDQRMPHTNVEEVDQKMPPSNNNVEAVQEMQAPPLFLSPTDAVISPEGDAVPELDREEDDQAMGLSIDAPEEMEAPSAMASTPTTPKTLPNNPVDGSAPELARDQDFWSKPISKSRELRVEPVNNASAPKDQESTLRSEGSHPDAAANVYRGAKGVWAWGKTIPVFSPFMGIAEAVAGTALGVAGTNLQDLDSNLLQPQLRNLDCAILNPAIETVAGIMLGAAGKAGEIVKPIVHIFLSPFKMLQQKPTNEVGEMGRNLQMG